MDATFQPFNPHAEVRVYRRNLPHWRQDGCTYFTTFRLVDSVPRSVLLRWHEDDENWLRAHGIVGPLTAENQEAYDGIAERERRRFERDRARRLHVELDKCHGSCCLRRAEVRRTVESAMLFFHGKRHFSGDFVIMPNHVHWLLLPFAGFELEDLLQSIKRFSSTQLGKALNLQGTLWQSENYDHIVRNRKELSAFRLYIEQNPEKARLRDNSFTHFQTDWLDENAAS